MEYNSFDPFSIPKKKSPRNNNTILIIIIVCIIICSYFCISISGGIGYFFYNKSSSNDTNNDNECSIMCGDKCLKPGELCNEETAAEVTKPVISPETTKPVINPETTKPAIDPEITSLVIDPETKPCNSPDGNQCWIKDSGETCCGSISGPGSCSEFISDKAQVGKVVNGKCVANFTDPVCIIGSNESMNQPCTIYTHGACCEANNSDCDNGIPGKIGRTQNGSAKCIKLSSVTSGKICNDDIDCNCFNNNTNCEFTCQRDTDSSLNGKCLSPTSNSDSNSNSNSNSNSDSD